MTAKLEDQLTLVYPSLRKGKVVRDWTGSLSEQELLDALVSARLGAAFHAAFREASRLYKVGVPMRLF